MLFFNILERYLFIRHLATMLLALVGLNGLIWLIWASRGDLFFAAGLKPALEYLGLTLLVLPLFSSVLLPIAFLLGGLMVFARLNRDSELVIYHASGVLKSGIARPILGLGIVTALVTAMLSLHLGPSSMRKFEQSVANASAELIFSVFEQGKFKKLSEGLTVHIGTTTGTSGLEEIFISDERDPDIHFIYYANKGAIVMRDEGAYLSLAEGEIHRIERTSEAASVVKFDSYSFDFSALLANEKISGFPLNARYLGELLNPDLNDPLFQSDHNQIKRELLDRFSSPLYALTFAAAILFFSSKVTTGRQSQLLLGSIAFVSCVVIRSMGWVFLSYVGSGWFLPLITFVIPVFVTLVFLLGYWTGRQFSVPQWILQIWLKPVILFQIAQDSRLIKLFKKGSADQSGLQ